MSIINEALKKAGKEKEYTHSVPVLQVIKSAPEMGAPAKKPSFNWGPLFVILVLLLITGPIVAPLFSTPFKRGELIHSEFMVSQQKEVSAPVPASTPAPRQFLIEESPLFQSAVPLPANPPALNLSGIMRSPSDAYCIINNKIVKMGESIEGARLIRVESDHVVLDFKGREITVSLSQ